MSELIWLDNETEEMARLAHYTYQTPIPDIWMTRWRAELLIHRVFPGVPRGESIILVVPDPTPGLTGVIRPADAQGGRVFGNENSGYDYLTGQGWKNFATRVPIPGRLVKVCEARP